MREALDHEVALGLAETFKALSDPTRIKIICALAKWELCVGELGATLDMSESAVSHQLSFLRSIEDSQVPQRRAQGLLLLG
jgi:DNA-binding transcriptional ArsR family regulator